MKAINISILWALLLLAASILVFIVALGGAAEAALFITIGAVMFGGVSVFYLGVHRAEQNATSIPPLYKARPALTAAQIQAALDELG